MNSKEICSVDIYHQGKVIKAKIFETWKHPSNEVLLCTAAEPSNYWMVQNFYDQFGHLFDTVASLQTYKAIEEHKRILKGLGYVKDERCSLETEK